MDNSPDKTILISLKVFTNKKILLVLSFVSFIFPSYHPNYAVSGLENLQTTANASSVDPDDIQQVNDEFYFRQPFQDSIDNFNDKYEVFNKIKFCKENLDKIRSFIKDLVKEMKEIIEIDKQNRKDKNYPNEEEYPEHYSFYVGEAEHTLNHLENEYYHELKSKIDDKIKEIKNEIEVSENFIMENFKSRNLLGVRTYSQMTSHKDDKHENSFGYFLFETLQSLMGKEINTRKNYFFVNFILEFSPKKEIISKIDTDLYNDIKRKLRIIYDMDYPVKIFEIIRFMKNSLFKYGLDIENYKFDRTEKIFMEIMKKKVLNKEDIKKIIEKLDKIKKVIGKRKEFKEDKSEGKQKILNEFESNLVYLILLDKRAPINFINEDYSSTEKIELLEAIKISIEKIENEDWEKNKEFLNFLFSEYAIDVQRQEDENYSSDSDQESEDLENKNPNYVNDKDPDKVVNQT